MDVSSTINVSNPNTSHQELSSSSSNNNSNTNSKNNTREVNEEDKDFIETIQIIYSEIVDTLSMTRKDLLSIMEEIYHIKIRSKDKRKLVKKNIGRLIHPWEISRGCR